MLPKNVLTRRFSSKNGENPPFKRQSYGLSYMDGCAVLCLWGSRRSGYQRGRVIPAASEQEAQALAEQIVARKLRRGMCVWSGYNHDL